MLNSMAAKPGAATGGTGLAGGVLRTSTKRQTLNSDIKIEEPKNKSTNVFANI